MILPPFGTATLHRARHSYFFSRIVRKPHHHHQSIPHHPTVNPTTTGKLLVSFPVSAMLFVHARCARWPTPAPIHRASGFCVCVFCNLFFVLSLSRRDPWRKDVGSSSNTKQMGCMGHMCWSVRASLSLNLRFRKPHSLWRTSLTSDHPMFQEKMNRRYLSNTQL